LKLKCLGLRATRSGCEWKDSIRKTFATFYHEEQGVSVRTSQQWLGHSDLETTMASLKGSDAASERSQAQVAKAYEAFV
jgi:integrase